MLQAITHTNTIGRFVSSKASAKPYELGILVLWLTAIFLPDFPGVTPVRYLSVLYFLSFLILDAQPSWTAIRKSWILLPLVVWGIFSVFWSPYPMAAFRVSALIACSVLVTIIIGSRYTPDQFFKCIVITGILGTVYASAYLPTANIGGPYASKNYLALHMLVSYIAFIAMALDKKTPIVISFLLLAFAGVAGFIIYKSDAVSALLLMIGATAVLIAVKWVFVGLANVRGARTLLFIAACVITLAGALFFFNVLSPQVVDDFLALFGKDSSLTGRTDLWAAAKKIMSDRPVTGIGLEGFWQYNVGAAQTLVENDHKDYGTKLGFHSAYLEIGAHLGFVGLGLFIASVIWATSIISFTFLRNPNMVSGGFFTLMIVCLVNSFTESFLSASLNIPVSVYFGAATMYSVWSKPRPVARLVTTQSKHRTGYTRSKS